MCLQLGCSAVAAADKVAPPPPCTAPCHRYSEQQKPRVLVSLAAVGLFMAVGWPLIVYYTGWAGFVKFWLMPWLGYHFWMSEWLGSHACGAGTD